MSENSFPPKEDADTKSDDPIARKQKLFWDLYLSERDFIKHHENQRTSASNIMGAIAAGLVVASGTAQLSPASHIAISLTLMMIGLFGYLFVGKLSSLIKLHGERSYVYMRRLITDPEDNFIEQARKRADEVNKKNSKFFFKLRLATVWSLFHLFIFVVGLGFLASNLELWGLTSKIKQLF